MMRQGHLALATLAALSLAACGGGGGGGGDSPPPAATPPPGSGTYAWLLKAEGATDNLKFGLSLLHPLDTGAEFVIEAASAAVTDAKLVATATVDSSSLQTSALAPYALVYVVGGDVRRVPLRADGSAPAGRVQRAQTSSACRFVLDAVDHVTPERSRFVLSTAGTDGVCNTADDGRAELRLDAALGLVVTPLGAAVPLAALRDPVTLAPHAWLLPTEVQLWAGSTVAFRSNAEPVTRVVAATYRSALVESARGLSVLDIAAAGAVSETALPAVTGSGWQAVGFDAQNYYAWRNSGGATGNWAVQRISRNAPAATLLATGSGEIALASMGTEVLYITTVNSSASELRRLLKAVPGAAQLLYSGPAASTLSTVLTGAGGVHLQWRLSGLDTATPSYRIDMVDENGNSLYSSTAGGFSLGPAEAARVSFNSSESRTRFLFVEGYGSRFFGDATLVAYDSVARAATRVGQLPGSAEFGIDYVFANVVAGPVAPGTGFASRSINGVVQSSGTRVFSFDAGAANSLKFTTRQQ